MNSAISNSTEKDENFDSVYNFFMKLYFYLGLVCFTPYFILNFIKNSLSIVEIEIPMILLIVGSFIFLFIMDNIGMRSSFIDRISRLVTLIFTVIGAFLSIFLMIIPQLELNNPILATFYFNLAIIITFEFLGWFFIRNSRGLSKVKKKPLYNTSMWALLLCGIVFLMEYFLNNAIFVFLAILFGIYPIIIIKWGKPKVIPSIKPRKLVSRYKRMTFYNYTIDITKAIVIILTIFAVLYDGTVVLYPAELELNPKAWIRNLAIVGIFAAIAMEFYNKIQSRFYGLGIIIILYLLCLIQYFLVNTFYVYKWWLIAPINGFTLAGVFYFIEQKIYKSNNVRALPGSFYLLILFIIIIAIGVRMNPEVDDVIENMKFTLSIIGIAYIIGYIREAPKQTSLRISI